MEACLYYGLTFGEIINWYYPCDGSLPLNNRIAVVWSIRNRTTNQGVAGSIPYFSSLLDEK